MSGSDKVGFVCGSEIPKVSNRRRPKLILCLKDFTRLSFLAWYARFSLAKNARSLFEIPRLCLFVRKQSKSVLRESGFVIGFSRLTKRSSIKLLCYSCPKLVISLTLFTTSSLMMSWGQEKEVGIPHFFSRATMSSFT
ncbi:hypothetical protein PoB_002067700 [Plakobranchus ocellatus]|uniref:Uncharacterized protein n=1 Tax=Plakobranchus ocellatus TaxID=259542 RepID=A0AAV3ZFU0_9GAST|nr:hypothetical protein PoB_002067700 [Plakobranchus ocellatus]